MTDVQKKISSVVAIVISAIIIIGAFMIIIPNYNVYKNTLMGKANLRQQEFEKQIIIEQAKADLESAKYLADAEIERARGVAEANNIIGNSLENGGDKYLQYLAIEAQRKMADSPNNTILYIPSGNNAIPLVQTVK
jgi:regulator of protease activity HflC (stomatin/prohibitin superfamily)